MREATAWIIELGHGLRAALASSELVHLVPGPTLFDIPQTPDYCRNLIVWEGAMVPVLDLAFRLVEKPVERSELFVGLIGFQEHPGDGPRRGALRMTGIPTRVTVNDGQACDLPSHPSGWRHVACSCFVHENEAIPVLDLPFLFSGATGPGERMESVNCRRAANDGLVSNQFITAQACCE